MALCTALTLPHGSRPKAKVRASGRLVSIPRQVHPCKWTTQVMSRQGKEPEIQMILKRPRQEDRLVQHSSSTSIPSSIVPSFQGIDIVPAIRGVHDHMSTWMSSLIHAQDGVPTNGCSTGFYGQGPPRAPGTAGSTVLHDAVYD